MVRTDFRKFWKLFKVFSRTWKVLESSLSRFKALESDGILKLEKFDRCTGWITKKKRNPRFK